MLRRLILTAAAALLLSGCGESAAQAILPCDRLASALAAAQGFPENSGAIYSGSPEYDRYLEQYYLFPPSWTEDGAVIQAGGIQAEEIAVFRISQAADAEKAAEALEDYRARRAGDFTGYGPEQERMVLQGRTARKGGYVCLLICPDPKTAASGLTAALSSGETGPAATYPPLKPAAPAAPTEAPAAAAETPETEISEQVGWVYDHDGILRAWQSGEDGELDEKNTEILLALRRILPSLVTDQMRDVDRELAVHDFLIQCAEYDPAAISHLNFIGEEDPDNGNPYGLLFHGKTVCSGYTTTFQLMMDCLGIECITVTGTANRNRGEHAWNMVRLDGEWYCVDVTWDDPAGLRLNPDYHRYFNVTSEFMRQTRHYWEESQVPEATAEDFGRKP